MPVESTIELGRINQSVYLQNTNKVKSFRQGLTVTVILLGLLQILFQVSWLVWIFEFQFLKSFFFNIKNTIYTTSRPTNKKEYYSEALTKYFLWSVRFWAKYEFFSCFMTFFIHIYTLLNFPRGAMCSVSSLSKNIIKI